MAQEALPSGRPRSAIARSPLLRLSVAIIVLYWLMAVFYFAIDPFDLYPWGIVPRLLPIDYPPPQTRYLVDIVAKDPTIDTVLVGGSTSREFSRAMMQKILGAANPFNLSYGGSQPLDRALITAQLLKYSHARRVILAFDYDYALDEESYQKTFPLFLYDDDPLNDLRMADTMGVRTAWSRLRAQGVVVPVSAQAMRSGARPTLQSPAASDALRRLVARHAASIDRPSRRGCDDFPALRRQLIPYAQALSRKGVELDIFLPPYSMFAYYDFAEIGGLGTSAMNDQLSMRRCLMAAVADLPGVAVFAFDNDTEITDNLANFEDSSHTNNREVQAVILTAIQQRTHMLTPQNVEEYLGNLHRRILAVKIPGPHAATGKP